MCVCIYGVVNRIIKSSSRIGLTTIVENLCYRVIRKSNTIRKWLNSPPFIYENLISPIGKSYSRQELSM